MKKKTSRGVDISSTKGMRDRALKTNWVLVAHQGGARIFQYRSHATHLEQIKTFSDPEGQKKDTSLVTDRPGSSLDRWTKAPGASSNISPRHGYEQPSPSQHQMEVLTTKIADWLNTRSSGTYFDSLILVMGPQMLGTLRPKLEEPLNRLIRTEYRKDFAWLTSNALKSRLADLLGDLRLAPPRHLPRPQGASGAERT